MNSLLKENGGHMFFFSFYSIIETCMILPFFAGVSLGVAVVQSASCHDDKMCMFMKRNVADTASLYLRGKFLSGGIELSVTVPGIIQLTKTVRVLFYKLIYIQNDSNYIIYFIFIIHYHLLYIYLSYIIHIFIIYYTYICHIFSS